MSAYAEVILPLPLAGTFTYQVPPQLASRLAVGMRVLVPLGQSKHYVAIVDRLTDEKPQFDCKPIAELLDGRPTLLPDQLRIWHWISDYYMSPLGDIMQAALPIGLRTVGRYKPKTETYVTLPPELRNEVALHVQLNLMRRQPSQLKIFNTYLYLSHWDTINGRVTDEPVQEVTKEELVNETETSTTMMMKLVKAGRLQTYEKEVGRLSDNLREEKPAKPKALSEAQTDAYNQVLLQMMQKNVVLLHGVTSSGKTEVYIHLIEKTLQEGKQVLYLLPEIALTMQIMERLRSVFGSRLGIYHSRYSDAERVEIWRKQLSEEPYDVILGARSAVFLPMQRLGLVIIDEEHDPSFKQQEPAPRYHARSVATVIAQMAGAKTLLGTATPSVESYHNAMTGKYGLVKLMTRYKDMQLPQIEVVDMKDLQRRKMLRGAFSPGLITTMRETLKQKRQVILFQNRRGYAPSVECKNCGWVPHCERCDVALTLHRKENILSCHYCGAIYAVPQRCPNCEGTEIIGHGYGTEKVEDQVRELLPEARTSRMDLDTTHTRNAYRRIIDDFSALRTNVLIGTQMVTKGLDFDRVSVVGILNADAMMNMPDFRAYERAYAMMSQVSGRAGRKGKRGIVMLQTKDPTSRLIRQVVDNDYEGFYHDQIEERRAFNFPPFCRLVYIYLRHRSDTIVTHAAEILASRLRQSFAQRVLGPDKPDVARVSNLCIRKIVLKLELNLNRDQCRDILLQAVTLLQQTPSYTTVQVFFDVDPM